jgi:uncharacterized membrane protein
VPVRHPAARFAVYGTLGLVVEVVFTGTHEALASRGRRVRGHTSGWMFPVYGLIQPLFEPAHDAMRGRLRWPARALLYAGGFLAVEYASGAVYRRVLGAAPWDYSRARSNIHGLVRMDYAIYWAAAGLVLERVDDALRGGCAEAS